MKIRIKRSMLIEASIQELAGASVASIIGQDEYDKIKADDEHPMFVQLDVGRQGISSGPVIIAGIRKLMDKIWSSTRIQELSKWLNKKVALFVGHNKDNSHKGRREIGETIKGWTEEQDDGEHAVGLAYISSENADVQEMIRSKFLDTCSIEADLRFTFGKMGRLFVDKILDLTGIALGDTKLMRPGFATAGIVGIAQEMTTLKEEIESALEKGGVDTDLIEIVDDDDLDKKKKATLRRKSGMPEEITIEDVQGYIKRMRVVPNALYELEELLKVPEVSDAMQTEIQERVDEVTTEHNEVVTGYKASVKEKEDALVAKDADFTKEKDTLTQELEALKPYKTEARRGKVSSLVRSSAALKDAPKEQVEYIATHINVPEDVELEGDKIGPVVEDAIKQQLEDIERHGIKFATKAPDKKPDGSGGEDGDDGDGGGGGDNDQNINPLIP